MTIHRPKVVAAALSAAILAATPAAAGYWQAGLDCMPMDGGCSAAICGAWEAWGKHGALDGFSSGGCTIEDGLAKKYYIKSTPIIDIVRVAHASLVCEADENAIDNRCVGHHAPGGDPGASGGECSLAGNPIDIITGAKTDSVVDLQIGQGPTALILERYYNSTSPMGLDVNSSLGVSWRTNFDITAEYSNIWAGMPSRITFRLPEGREIGFIWNSPFQYYDRARPFNGSWQSGNRMSSDRLDYANGVLTLTTRKDEIYRFDLINTAAPGQPLVFDIRLQEIANRNGRSWTPIRDVANKIVGFENQHGARFDFTFDADDLLTDVAGSHGVTATYSYADVTSAASGVVPPNALELETIDSGPAFDLFLADSSSGPPASYGRVLSQASITLSSGAGASEVTTYHYENENFPYNLTGVTDAKGVRYATWTYDDRGRGLTSAHAQVNGHPTNLTSILYGAVGANTVQTIEVTNPLGQISRYTVENGKRGPWDQGVRRISNVERLAIGSTPPEIAEYVFDANDTTLTRLRQEVSPGQWRETDLGMDTLALLQEQVRGDGAPEARTIDTDWDPNHRRPTRILEPNLDTRLTYGANGLPLTITQTDRLAPTDANGVLYGPTERRWTFTYTADGQIATVNGPLVPALGQPDDVTTYAYDANGHLASTTDPLGHVTQIASVNGRGQPLRVVEPDGVAIELTYDFRGRPTAIIEDADGARRATTLAYDAVGLLIQSVDPDGVTLSYAYDDARRLIRMTDGRGGVTSFEHDAMGNVTRAAVSATQGGAPTWETSSFFDAAGRLQRVLGGAGQEHRWLYDQLGRVIEATDGLGSATPSDPTDGTAAAAYDALDRVISTVDRAGQTIAKSYDATEALQSYTDPRTLTTTFVRNGFGEVVEEQSPDRGTRVFYRDARGLVVTSFDARGVEADYAYDVAGQLTAITFPNAPTTDEDVLVTRGGAGAGVTANAITQVDDESGATLYGYAADGRVNQLTRQLDGQSYGLGIGLTAGDRVSTLTYPSGREVRYDHDAAGDIVSIETSPSAGGATTIIASGVEYAPFGPISRITYGNGAIHTASHDLAYRLTEQRDQSTGDLRRVIYGYDANDNLTSTADQLSPATEAFTYDPEDRLATATGAYGLFEFAYDGSGNRTLKAHTPSGGARDQANYLYPLGSNRLDQVTHGPGPNRSFTYDLNGNTVQESLYGTVYDYAYNRADRLATVDRTGVRAAEYWYDHNGQLSIRRLFDAAGQPTATIHVIHDLEGRRIAEHDGATGAVLREYVWLEDRPIAVIDGLGTVLWVHVDHINRPVMMTDAAQAVVWEASWTPFGAAHVVTDVTANTLRFPGQWFQLETELHQNWHRDYDPTLGRYLQPDRLGLVDGPSVYNYVGQNPITRIDPTGERLGPGAVLAGVARAMSKAITNATRRGAGRAIAAGTAGAGLNAAFWGGMDAGYQAMTKCDVDWGQSLGVGGQAALGGLIGFSFTGVRLGLSVKGAGTRQFSHMAPWRWQKQSKFGRWLEGGDKPWQLNNALRDLNGNYVSNRFHMRTDPSATPVRGAKKVPPMAMHWRALGRTPGWAGYGAASGAGATYSANSSSGE